MFAIDFWQHFSFAPNVTKLPLCVDIGNFSSYYNCSTRCSCCCYSLAPTATLRKITKICKFVLAKSRSRQTICWLRRTRKDARTRMRNCCHFTSARIDKMIDYTQPSRRSPCPRAQKKKMQTFCNQINSLRRLSCDAKKKKIYQNCKLPKPLKLLKSCWQRARGCENEEEQGVSREIYQLEMICALISVDRETYLVRDWRRGTFDTRLYGFLYGKGYGYKVAQWSIKSWQNLC